MNWPFSADDEAQFHHVFLRRHSPFLFIDNTNAPLPKSIHLLRRAARTFVNGLAYRNVLVKLDGTTPEFDETKVSYRYPFIADGEHVAPSAYKDWDTYQGDWGEVRRSVRSFIREVRGELAVFREDAAVAASRPVWPGTPRSWPRICRRVALPRFPPVTQRPVTRGHFPSPSVGEADSKTAVFVWIAHEQAPSVMVGFESDRPEGPAAGYATRTSIGTVTPVVQVECRPRDLNLRASAFMCR